MRPGLILARAVLLAIVVATLVPVGTAMADPYQQTITRQFTHKATEVPDIPEEYRDAAGNLYGYQDRTSAPDPAQGVLSKNLSREVYITTGLVDVPSSTLATTLDVDEEGFAGTLTLADHSQTPVYESRSRMVDRAVVYDNLPDNDVTQLPTEESFTVTSDSSPDATTTASLRRAAVTMAVAATDEQGLPRSYSATVIFRGEERYLEQVGWDVTGTYTGTISKKDVRYLTTATYTLVQPATVAAPVVSDTGAGMPEPAGFLDTVGAFLTKNGPLIGGILGAGLLVALFTTAAALYRRRRENSGEGGRGHAA